MNEQAISHFLQLISLVNNKYKEIAKITGTEFNIFSLLKLQSDEVRLHSRFIGELLNPSGSHGKGSLFLELFIKRVIAIRYDEYNKDDLLNAKVIVEEYIGEISQDYMKGGSIDIVVKPERGKKIVIENKIYTGDQRNQIIRYKNHYPNEHFLYLTLDGRIPGEISIGKLLKEDSDFTCISYKNEILNWLEDCLKETISLPMLRETIAQYINVIKKLTGVTMNNQMSQEIAEIIVRDAENIEAAFLMKNLDIVKQTLAIKLKEQITKVAIRHNLKLGWHIKQFNNLYEGFMLFHPDLDKDNLAIVFQFLQNGARNFMYGIMLSKYDVTINGKVEKRNFNEIGDNISADGFIKNDLEKYRKLTGLNLQGNVAIAYTSFQGLENWNGKEFGEISNERMTTKINDKVKMLIDKFKELNPERYKFNQ